MLYRLRTGYALILERSPPHYNRCSNHFQRVGFIVNTQFYKT